MASSYPNTLCEHLGLEKPIVQAPMAGVQDSDLAVAVSEAGGLGSVPCGTISVDRIRAELESVRQRTDRPFNVNFFCHSAPPADPVRDTAWREALAPYYRELNVDPAKIPTGSGRDPFNQAMADVVAECRPPVVSFHFGLPAPDLLARVKESGAYVLSSATTVEEARWLVAHGADAVIAQGLEAGGHRGMFLTDDITTQIGTLALVRQVVEAVDVPVIAAGGIVDRHSVAAALALGAQAVQAGSAYLRADEAKTSTIHRQALASEAVRHTALTRLYSGRPARAIVNRLMRELGPMSDLPPAFPGAVAAILPLRAAAEAQGSGDFTSMWAGQAAALCQAGPAAAITAALAEGAVSSTFP